MQKVKKVSVYTLSFFLTALPVFLRAEGWNPIKASSISELVTLIVNTIIMILMPIMVLAIIYSGFMFLVARGNEEKLKKAKINLIWVIAGTAILLGARIITAILENTSKEILK